MHGEGSVPSFAIDTEEEEIDPEEEAFRALKKSILKNCQRKGITNDNDPRLTDMVNKYRNAGYPRLTTESIFENEYHDRRSSMEKSDAPLSPNDVLSLETTKITHPPPSRYFSFSPHRGSSTWWSQTRMNKSAAVSPPDQQQQRSSMSKSDAVAVNAETPGMHSSLTLRRGNTARSITEDGSLGSLVSGGPVESLGSHQVQCLPPEKDDERVLQGGGVGRMSPLEEEETESNQPDEVIVGSSASSSSSSSGATMSKKKGGGGRCWSNFIIKCGENGGFNLLTYVILLSFFAMLAYVSSVISTYLSYNQGEYRDWALAGGVTSTSASFRVRGPSTDDGNRREFVVGTNPNLAIETDQILKVPVSYGDFALEEHFVKSLYIDTLLPRTPYYYGITRPQRTPNSAVVAGEVGFFVTPAPEGSRMDFTIATGSCALTGSKSASFSEVLALNPLMFIHMGDLHYEDLNTLDIDERLGAYDRVLGSPSQRLLYQRTIFSYIWDDHDWLGNNQDSEDEAAASVAKQSYSLGIPHYPLGSSSSDTANAAKYQAFTIGTVRFILTDLRSESLKSTEQSTGRIFSTEQKEWLFSEFDQAANYDYVVWVNSRPWTEPVKVGSDSWGGFAVERNEISVYIAATIGAGPRNLLVLSGDNHMVAFDDGSSTDYSGQDVSPGGFPLLHSGPLANYGPGATDFFSPETFYFTDGCMAKSSELNHQFSTLDFLFPSDANQLGCVRIRSYLDYATNIIFEKELCGEVMKFGTLEQDNCTTKRMTVPSYSVFSAAAVLVVLGGLLSFWMLGLKQITLALSYFGLGVMFYVFTVGAAIAGAVTFGTIGVNMFAVSVCLLAQAVAGAFFVFMAIFGHHSRTSDQMKSDDDRITDKGRSGLGRAIHANCTQNTDERNITKIADDASIIDDAVNRSTKVESPPTAFILNDLARTASEIWSVASSPFSQKNRVIDEADCSELREVATSIDNMDEVAEVKRESSTIRTMRETIASGGAKQRYDDDSEKNASINSPPENEAVPYSNGLNACDLNHSFGEGLGFVAACSRGLFSFGNNTKSPRTASPGEPYGRLVEE